MLDPKDLTLTDQKGTEHHYRIGRIPYMDGGREVCSQYMTTAAPKLGDYKENQRIAEILLGYVSVILDEGREVPLSTRQLINNHVPDFVTGIKLEEAALSHNLGFSLAGKIQQYQQDFTGSIKQFLTKILTPSPGSLSTTESPPCTNSEPGTQ